MSNTALYVLASMSLVLPSLAGSAIFTKQDATMTFYYDISEASSGHEACGATPSDPVTAGWATASGINAGVPFCERVRGYSLDKIGTDNIVAFDATAVQADPEKWCGREVQIYKADGSKFENSGGPLYIWDGCAACAGGGAKLDLSAPTFVEIKGGTCSGTNPTGLSYEVLDNYIVEPSVGLGAGAGAAGGASATAAGAATPTAGTGSTPSSEVGFTTSAGSPPILSSIGSVVSSSDETTSEQVAAAPTRTIRYSSSFGRPTSSSSSNTGMPGIAAAAYVDPDSSSVESPSASLKDDISTTSSDVEALTATDVPTTTTSMTDSASTPASTAPTSVATTSALYGDDCTFGDWQCTGLQLRVCNYQSTSELAWETIETCKSVCQVTPSGSIDCQ
ncbi:hypothetical protein IAR55_001979 [Kwoniella newhampshirensis]|uniref:Uncharacterized protein n=1 Tax=Kwoniella newhampshirensis TaxID=1651941 RepID=A0AAW0Z3J1_9TREE